MGDALRDAPGKAAGEAVGEAVGEAARETGGRVRDVGVVHAPWEPVDAADVIAGHPSTRALPLFVSDGPVEAGLWEMSAGAARDVEVDEVCLILAGRATLSINDDPPVELAAGSFVTLRAGDRTEWVVHDQLQKLYLVAAQ